MMPGRLLHTVLGAALLCIARGALRAGANPGADLPDVAIAHDEVTISGISAGGFAAIQMHIAYSKTFRGAAVIAGGPYWCAQDNEGIALTSCMEDGKWISSAYLAQIVRNTALTGFADDPIHLLHDRVWLFSGTKDTVVDTDVVKKARDVYAEFLGDSDRQMTFEGSVPAEHAMITLGYGSDCGFLGSPFINLCKYDAAGALLQHLFNHTLTKPATRAQRGKAYSFSQAAFYGGSAVTAAALGMARTGYVYVPPQCENRSQHCALHVALHGCLMTQDDIGMDYVLHSGYVPWADENGIVVLFPQAMKNLLNPKGCFDWWGYAGTAYASNIGTQTLGMKWMMESLMSIPLTPNTTMADDELAHKLDQAYSADPMAGVRLHAARVNSSVTDRLHFY